MIIAVVGSRDYPGLTEVAKLIRSIAERQPDAVIVSGGARGVDVTAESEAASYGLGVVSYRPYEYTNMKYQREFSIEIVTIGERAQQLVVDKSRRISPPYFGNYATAAFRRNDWIVDDAELLMAFWDGKSRGTDYTVTRSLNAGVKTFRREPRGTFVRLK